MEFDTYSRAEVIEKLFALWTPRRETETLPLEQSHGRICGADLRSRLSLPELRSSGGDGIAVRSADFAGPFPDTSTWREGFNYIRADTGDDFDDRFDAVIMIEALTFNEDGGFSLPPGFNVLPGMNVRGRGDLVMEGDLLLKRGLPIRACDMGALAMGGITEVPVLRKPVTAFIPTGNELVPPGAIPKRGQNIDSNSVMIRHLLLEMGAEPLIFPIVRDEAGIIRGVLEEALERADLVLVNGGSSKGAEDHNARLLAEMGQVLSHGVNSAPGRPLCVALIGGKPVINLPGPMLATYFGADWCIRGIICRALGIPVPQRPKVKAVLKGEGGPRKLPEGFELFCRVALERTGSGYEASLALPGKTGGERIAGFSSAQCILKGPNPPAGGGEIEVELSRGAEFI
ncbi:MAG: molybdopterin molybdotransferase MoeA [Treponema sp.]|jgi:molybdopterin molybdotransferase/putative molybdopterin biosynthesis protein|nr:molybdopterin molybdotransferase MoeA [Treponema sp.]